MKGCGGYFLNRKDKETCFYFIFENDFIFDYVSVSFDIETDLIIKTIEKSEMLVVPKSKFLSLTESHPVGEKLRRIGIEMLYHDTQQQYLDLLTLTAKERYDKLLLNHIEIAQKIDHKHIASFLGITPQSLSRLRKTANGK